MPRKKKTDRSVNTPDVLRALKKASRRKKTLKNITGSQPSEQHISLAVLRAEIRTALDALGIAKMPSAKPGSPASEKGVQDICTAINRLIAKNMQYTFDQDLKPDTMIRLVADDISPEIWVAKWREFLNVAQKLKKGKVKDDCDGYSTIALVLAWAAGIPAYRLAFGVVISETALVENKNKKPVTKLMFDHAIGMYWAFNQWWALGDTWDQDTYEYTSLVSARHVLYMYAKFDEGFTFRYADEFETLMPLGLKPLQGASVAARPLPRAQIKNYTRRFTV